ncbi:hypothetical protein DRO97_06425 [Archaeoglobales archaeon]|nr:MAG: hypothetical protein DRO97_06425 [Archaeoglobales archaeon]
MKDLTSLNKEIIRDISSELGISEEKVPVIVDKIAELVRQQVNHAIVRRTLMAMGLGGLLATALPVSAKMTITDQYVDLDGEKFYPSPVALYSAAVYIDGSKVKAEDWRGKLIQEGVAGVEDASVIQSAIDNLTPNRTWKEKVVVLKGSFTIGNSIEVPSWTILDLRQSRLYAKDGLNKKIIVNKNAETGGDVEIDIIGGYIHGNKSNQTSGEGIHLKNASYCKIISTEVFQAKAENILLTTCHHIELIDIFSFQAGITGLTMEIGCHHINIVGGIFNNNEYYGIGIEHFGSHCHHININGIISEANTKNGILIDRGKQINVCNSQIIDNQESGIAGDGLIECNIISNVIQGNYYNGINLYLDQASEGFDNNIIGNQILLNKQHGIRIDDINRTIIALNKIKDNSQEQTNVYSGIMLESGADYHIIYANECINTQATPKQAWGINAYWVNDVYIYLNRCYNNVSGQISIGGGSNQIAKLNIGYITENKGTATITAGNTSVTVSHGLVSTPSKVIVTPIGDPGDRFWVANIGASSFDIVVATAPGSDVEFNWEAEV